VAVTILTVFFTWFTVFLFEEGSNGSKVLGVAFVIIVIGAVSWMLLLRRHTTDHPLVRRMCRLAGMQRLGFDGRRMRVVIEDDRGSRLSLEAVSDSMSHHAADDFGVAYVRGTFLLDFQRVSV